MTQAQFNGAIEATVKHERMALSNMIYAARVAQADAKGYKAALKQLEL